MVSKDDTKGSAPINDEKNLKPAENSSEKKPEVTAKPAADQKTLSGDTRQKTSGTESAQIKEKPPIPPVESSAKSGASSGSGSPKSDNSSSENSNSKKKDKTEKPSGKSSPSKPSKPGGGFFKFLLIFLILVGFGLFGYWFYTEGNRSNELLGSIQSHEKSISRLENALQEERAARQQSSSALEKTANDLKLSINSHSNRLRELSTTTRDDWLLAEAEYLMRLASQRLVTERQTKNALALLETADKILRDLDEVDLFPVRKSLAEDITRLRVAVNVDREGLFLELNALAKQVVVLPLIQRKPAGDMAPVSAAEPIIDEGWQARLKSSFQNAVSALSKAVRVQKSDSPVEPLLSPDDEQLIRHNLRILLEQAQLSLLREEQLVYEASLNKAHDWLVTYFDLNDSTDELATQLAKLAKQDVIQQLPDISTSLEDLRVYIDSWHKRQEVAAPVTTSAPSSANQKEASP